MTTDLNSLADFTLYQAFLSLESEQECDAFFRDLCTPGEITAMKDRWRVVQLLFQGNLSYRSIYAKTGISVATITRVAKCLQPKANGGYQRILAKFANTPKTLYHAILEIKSTEICRAFFHDLCTIKEVKGMQERWQIARLLYDSNLSYRSIHTQTGASIATITRVARFLHHEKNDGYRAILQKMIEKNQFKTKAE